MWAFFVMICKVLASLLLAFSSLFPFTPANKEIKQIKQNTLVLPSDFSVTAHAGAMMTRPNTIASLRQIIETDVEITEIDVSFRPDGTAVIIHNSSPRKKQGVLLIDALKVISEHENMQVNLDLKAFWNLQAVLEDVVESGMFGRVFFTGVELENIEKVKEGCPGIPYYLNYKISGDIEDKEMLNELVSTLKDCGAVGINLNYVYASSALCDIMHENGLLVSVWTVNSKFLMYKMLDISPDNITTKRPNKLLKIIKDWQE